MSRARRWLWRRRAFANDDIARLQFGLAERLAKLRGAGAQLRRCRRPLRPDSHRRPLATKRYHCMNRPCGLDVEREPCAPNPCCGFDFIAATVARNLELRHGCALRGRKWNFEIPARCHWIAPYA